MNETPDWSEIGNLDTYPELHKKSEEALNAALSIFDSASVGPSQFRMLVGLNVQAAMVNFDIVHESMALLSTKPSGFALQVALRSLVMRCFEFHEALRMRLVPRAREAAAALGLPFDTARVVAQRKALKTGLHLVSSWSAVRNNAAGHYGQDTELQFSLLRQVSFDDVVVGVNAVLDYITEFIQVLHETLTAYWESLPGDSQT